LQYPWLGQYVNDWPATSILKQYLKGNRNRSRRKVREAAARAAAAAATTSNNDV